MTNQIITQQLLSAAWQSLNEAAADLVLVLPLTDDTALATDIRVLPDAVEEEIKALAAAAQRWDDRRR